jgi:hypothetical protein
MATAVSTAAGVARLRKGAERFSTGGADGNSASVTANTWVGQTVDEKRPLLASLAP